VTPARLVPILFVLVYATAVLLAFSALDRRPPNDHDNFYLGESLESIVAFSEAGWAQRPGILLDHFAEGELHPRLVPIWVVTALGTFGASRFNLRASNLPFLLLLVGGTWLLGRELGGDRLGVLAAFVVGNLPIVLNMSRKFFFHFHAAALAPLGLYLAVRLIRSGDVDRRGLWAAFGLWQALRLYVHPVTLGDTFLTLSATACLVVFLSWRDGASLRPALAGAALAVGLFLFVGGPYLGYGPGVFGDLPYALPRYLGHRTNLLEVGLFSSPLAVASLAFDLAREVVWMHVFPVTAALLLAGLICLVGLGLDAGSALRGDRRRSAATLLLGFVVVAQVPPMMLAVANRGFSSDWLVLAPTAVVLALLGLHGATEGLGAQWRSLLRAGLAATLVLAGLWASLAPLALAGSGQDPVAEPEAYGGPALSLFGRSPTGRWITTLHVPTDGPFPGARIAAALGETEEPTGRVRLAILDLSWRPFVDGESCRLRSPTDEASWAWGIPEGSSTNPLPSWPYLFAGWEGLEARELEPSEAIPGGDWDALVVRLWAGAIRRDSACARPLPPDGFVEEAADRVRARIGVRGTPELLGDPTGRLAGWTIEWEVSQHYLGAGLLFTNPSFRAPLDEAE
jgi:hypothetical protein